MARDREALVLGHVNLPHIWKKAHPLPRFDSDAGSAIPFGATIKELICPAAGLT